MWGADVTENPADANDASAGVATLAAGRQCQMAAVELDILP
jgi:hypothetical protein